MEDQKLLFLLEQDSEAGVRKLLDLYGDSIYRICKNFLYDCSEEDVEEAVADAVVNFWRGRAKFEPGENRSVKSYLYGIARNAARDLRRKRKRQSFFSDEEVLLSLPSEENIETDYEARQDEQLLHQCLSQMKEPDRSVFLFRYFYGYGIGDIAKKLGLTKKRTENILYRGKEKLRKMLSERGMHGDEKRQDR